MSRVRSAWRGARPSVGRLVIALMKVCLAVAVLSVVFFVVGAAVPAIYGAYGFHPEENAREWAALTPQYGGAAVCAKCHGAEYVPWSASKHAGVSCESCHGPLGDHALADPPTPVEGTDTADGTCARCHETVAGRPADFPTVTPADHYPGVTCLQCHHAHSAVAVPPPRVSHPLVNLPECTACHGFSGLQAMPVGHTEAPDRVCLSCHLPGATTR